MAALTLLAEQAAIHAPLRTSQRSVAAWRLAMERALLHVEAETCLSALGQQLCQAVIRGMPTWEPLSMPAGRPQLGYSGP